MNYLRIASPLAATVVVFSANAKLVQMPSSDERATQFLEDSQVSRAGDVVTLKFINELLTPQRVITKRRNYSYASQTFAASFDCKACTYKIENLALHSGSMGAGQIYPGEGAYKWRDLSDG
jgi:hypothetical protein